MCYEEAMGGFNPLRVKCPPPCRLTRKEEGKDDIVEDCPHKHECTHKIVKRLRDRRGDDINPHTKDCPGKRECTADVLKRLKDVGEPKEILIYVARKYLQLKLKDMKEIFRLDSSGISRLANKVDDILWKASYENRAQKNEGVAEAFRER
jgi:hypothetical protein